MNPIEYSLFKYLNSPVAC